MDDIKTFTYLGSIVDEHGGSDADVKAQIGKARAAYLQLKDIWNSRQLSTNTKVNTNVKTVLLYYEIHHPENTRESKPDSSGGTNKQQALEMDRTHNEESTQLRYEATPHLESSRPKEKRETKVHITPRNRDRNEKNEERLYRTRKKGPGQTGLENAGRWPMLHWG
ncbi:unnamed protein product [Schistosoma curassoni]|uniref:DUF6451 domain-containing protein n=1 Tax=Schistosoma curassoni TaxID=6186 RepID=A0A183KHP4_9TREM|nr:unnamed protein product [Schistosoma curassoni]